MELGLFFMPLHRPDKAWAQALDEDRQAILAADRAGYAEVWVGEHFTTKAEQIPAPLLFLSSLIHQTKLRLGTGVVNLGHRHPVVVAAEAALFDQLSGGRLMLGVGPGGLSSDAELFGRPDQEQRFDAAMEAIDMIKRLWAEEAPISLDGTYWQGALEEQFWPGLGVGQFPKPLQQPHPPLAMALVSPGGRTTETVAERSFIPISANFVPQSSLLAQWEAYRRRRQELGLVVDRSIWRVCRSLLVTDSDAEADELVSDPDGTFAFYFRYLGAVRGLHQPGFGRGRAAYLEHQFTAESAGGVGDVHAHGLVSRVGHAGRYAGARLHPDRMALRLEFFGGFGCDGDTGFAHGGLGGYANQHGAAPVIVCLG